MKKLVMALSAVLVLGTQAHADKYHDAMEKFYETNISTWVSDPVLIAAIKAQNEKTAGYDQGKIDAMDAKWRSDLYSPQSDFIDEVLVNPAADFLRTQSAGSSGAITEAFIMDAHGLNVAASEPTSDYWQGDEAKFQQTYSVGPNAVHYGDVELDSSSGAVQAQVSVTIVDPETGNVLGALTVGIDLRALG